jgi:LysM repeat protein
MQNRMLNAAAALAVVGFVAACAAPTPTAVNGVAPEVAAPSQAPVATREAQRIVVERGQSVSRLAAKYGMAQRAIIAANNLTPPYKIKIGQHLLIPSAGGPAPAVAVAGSPSPEIIPLDRPALPGSTAPPRTAAAASPAPPPVAPAPATTGGPPAASGSAGLPAPATTAAAAAPTPIPGPPPPPGITCPSGTIGMWSEDIIKKPVYICRRPPSQS